MKQLSELTTQNPNKAGLHFLLALAYFTLNDLPKSEARLHGAIALDPKLQKCTPCWRVSPSRKV